MKKINFAVLTLALLLLLSAFAACGEQNNVDTTPFTGLPEYGENIESYIEPFEYTGLYVAISDGVGKGEAVFTQIVENVKIIKYPELQVEYYAEQERIKYRYYADRDGIEYADLLSGLGITEESIIADAEEMVKKDLVLEYIVKKEEIVLTDAEKNEYFDKYAEKFVSLYGYDKAYVAENMADRIYDSMLFDKTMEFLILNNNFVEI